MAIGEFLIYILEVSIYLVLLTLGNKLLFRGDKLHSFSRILWIGTIVISLCAPFSIGLDHASIEEITAYSPQHLASGVSVDSPAMIPHVASGFEWVVKALFMLYFLGVTLSALHMIYVHATLLRMVLRRDLSLENSQKSEDVELLSSLRGYEEELGINTKVRYIVHTSDLPPFSWFGYIVVSHGDLEHNRREIITHELAHVKQHHTCDLLLANLLVVLLWFNPAAWMIRRTLQLTHEYCADDFVLSCGVDAKEYQLLLIKVSVGSRLQSISNTLNHSNLKNRITMMSKKKTSVLATAKWLYAIPVLLLLSLVFASPIFAQVKDAVSSVKVTNNSDKESTSESENKPFLAAEIMPTFQGGDLKTFRDWVMKRIKFPVPADGETIEMGNVIASFVIDEQGQLGQIGILKSPHNLLSEEVIRVLKSSPKWTPAQQRGVNVSLKYTIPVLFEQK